MLVARRFLPRSVGLALGLILLSVVVSGCFQTAGASLEPTSTGNAPAVVPPTAEPPTAEPPTAEPPTAGVPPTAEPPTAEPPTAPSAAQPAEAPTVPPPTIVVVTETPVAVAQNPTAAGPFVGGPEGTATADRATQFALATEILAGATQTAAVDQTATSVALGTPQQPGEPGQPTPIPPTGPLANVTGTPVGTLGAPGSGAAGGITTDCVYTVVDGDRLYRIALRFNLSAEAVSRYNGIVNVDMIVPGQRLRIPNCNGTATPAPTLTPGPAGASTVTPVPATRGGQGIYIVQEGDTLFGIAMRYGVRVMAIAQANGISNINLIYIGQRLTIP